MIHLNHRRSPCNSKSIKGLSLSYILFKARKWTPSWISHFTPHPVYFRTSVLESAYNSASDAFIESNKLAAICYSAPLSRIRSLFDISSTSRHTRLISAGSSRFNILPVILHIFIYNTVKTIKLHVAASIQE